VVVTTISLDEGPSNAGTKALWWKNPLVVAYRHHRLAQLIQLLLRMLVPWRQGTTDEVKLILIQTIFPVVFLSKDILSANVQKILDRCG
jgi:hypothetical protein